MKKFIVLVMAIAVIMTAGNALAATTNGTFDVTASVAAACSISASPDIAFGAYDPTGGDVSASGTLQFSCTKNTSYDITIDATRQMTGGTYSDTLSYEVYYEGAHTNAWASSTGNANGQGTTSSNATQSKTVYGLIAGGQDVSVDSYSQTIGIHINF
ncbi:MAG: spore coat U domain-containing protein [Nitrospirota bacterium]